MVTIYYSGLAKDGMVDGGDWVVKGADGKDESISLSEVLDHVNEKGHNSHITIISDCNYSGKWAAQGLQYWADTVHNYQTKFGNLNI